ncbi:MAG: YlbF family regulator [Firmicutes bacterium]|nr:YlbF family regulator [Bacillota bacterium]
MSEVLALARALAEAFRDSPELAAYRFAKAAVLSDPALARRLAEYKQALFGHRMKAASGETPPFDEEKILSHMYSELFLNDRTREFLEREEAAFGLVNGIGEILGEAYGEMEM